MIGNAKSFSDLYLQIAAAPVVSSKQGKLYQSPTSKMILMVMG